MKIKRLEIKNWLGLSEFAIDPGKINFLTGRKGSGKSSVIEALEKVFTNKNNRTEVVRHGETESTIFVETDTGLEVDRRVRTDKADYLKVKKPGETVPSTENFLKKLINGDIFRPLEFIKKTPEEQAKIILNMLDIPWTTQDIEKWFAELPTVNYEAHILQVLKQIENLYFTERETINREIKVLEAQVTGIRQELPANYDGEYWRAQKVQEYYSEVAEAEEVNKKIVNARNVIEGLESRIATIKAEAESDKQSKKSAYDRQRSDIREFKQFLTQKIEKNQETVNETNQKIKESYAALDYELEKEMRVIEKKYAELKEQSKKNLTAASRVLSDQISEHKTSIATKDQELINIDQLEEQSLQSIDENTLGKIETETAKAGTSKAILKKKEIDIEPLQKKANEVAEMQSYLREFDRVSDILKTKLAPRQEKSRTLTARIEKARTMPMELLKIASVPIPEIEVDKDGKIRIGKTLISGLSEGEQLELAFRVAKAQAGELKVVCLDGINKINETDREWIDRDMETDEYQYFVTETQDGEFAVEIREGK